MRKDQLDTETEYAYWDGHGGFAIPRTGHRAQSAFNHTLRVRVLDKEAPVHQDEWLVPPKSTGVLFKVLDHDGNDTFERISRGDGPWKNELITRWQPSARNFVMKWDELVAIIQPLLDELAVKLERDRVLHDLEETTAGVIATDLNIPKDLVSVDINEYEYSGRGKRSKSEMHESVSINIDFDTIKAVERWLSDHGL